MFGRYGLDGKTDDPVCSQVEAGLRLWWRVFRKRLQWYALRNAKRTSMGMIRSSNSVAWRYAVAIIVTSALMVWQSTDAVRAGSDLRNHALFWFAAVSAGWLQMILIARGVRASFGTDRLPGWALLAISALVGAVPLTFQVRWLMETIVSPSAGLPPPWITYLNVCVINLVFSTIQYLLIERWPIFNDQTTDKKVVTTGAAAAPAVGEAGNDDRVPTISMLSRRPDGLTGQIRYLQMEDHYLRVHTEHGDGLVLHRLSDATNDLLETDGLQVHKSWWVARAAISEFRNENRKRSIIASDGTIIPIGRSFEKKLREAGWI